MKTIVLDDDPTGTQSASGVTVLLECDADLLTEALTDADSVYVQTNSRALHEADAVALVMRIKAAGEEAARRLGSPVRFVLRGDSTLRGHVFAESEAFLGPRGVLVFVPAFPGGGRTTRGGVHYVRIGDAELPADQTEYADDPVFGFSTGTLVDYVAEKSGRLGLPVSLEDVRNGRLSQVLAAAPAGSVVLPDVVDDHDVRLIADAINASDADLVIRSAAPLAAELARVASTGLLPSPLIDHALPTLLVCGSHTRGATAQLDAVTSRFGQAEVLDTEAALADPRRAGLLVAGRATARLCDGPLAVIASQRLRSTEHGTLDHGERVMTALTTAVRELLPQVSVVVAKGGITSAEVARTGIGATSAVVLGQILPGVSVWRMRCHDDREFLYVVVPGNVGGPDTLVDVLAALRVAPLVSARSGGAPAGR